MTPALLYGLEILSVSEKHQHRLQVFENKWVRWIAGVKRVDRRRMDELREEVGIQKCLMGRLVKSRLKWAGHVERMKEDRLPRMAYVHQERGKRKTTYEMARLHRERHEKGGVGGRGLEDGGPG